MTFRTSTVEDIGVKLVTAGSGGSLREEEERERKRDFILICTCILKR